MDKLTISRILVENKYLLPVTKADTGVHVVDIPKAAEVLNELFQQKLKQCSVSGALTSVMKIYINANSMKYQDFVEWIRSYNGNDR